MQNHDDARSFDDLVATKLGHYVYALIDPNTGHPFYIGKGGGKQGRGNRRLLDHFHEAAEGAGKESPKVQRIREIWASHGDVPWRIIRSGMGSEEEAFLVECALIDMLREMKVPLTNSQSGHGSSDHGLKTLADLRAWSAKVIAPSALPPELHGRPIFVFNINKGVAARRDKYPLNNPALYEEATRQFWRVSKSWRAAENGIAVGVVNGISRAAIDIGGWRHAEGHRWEIIPSEPGNRGATDELLFRNFSPIINHCIGYWQRGNFLIFSFETNCQASVLRGSAERTITFPE